MKGHQVLRKKEQGKMKCIDLFAKYIKLGFAESMRTIIHSDKINNFSLKIFFSDDGRSNRFNLMKLQIVIQNCVNILFCKMQLKLFVILLIYIFHRNCANLHQENELNSMIFFFVIWPSFCQTCKFRMPFQFMK